MAENTTLTLTQLPSQANGQLAVGKVVFDATAITAADYIEIDVGFKPKAVEFVNATDRITGQYYEGMDDNSCIKTAANGVRTLEVTGGNGGITLTNNGFRVSQNATLAIIAASKTCYFRAQA
jgi:hypothetical protein